MKQKLRRCLAMLVSFTMILALLPASAAMADDTTGEGTSEAASQASVSDLTDVVLHYDMSHADGKLTDVSGNGNDGILKGITDADFTTDNGKTKLNFDGSAKYVQIPIAKQLMNGMTETFAIEATYTVADNNTSDAWLFTLGSDPGAYPRHDYLFVSPNTNQGSYKGHMLGAITQGSSQGGEKRYPTTKYLTGRGAGEENTVQVLFEAGDVTYYLNGEATDVTETDYSIQTILSAGTSDEKGMGYIGKSLYTDDPYFKGTVTDFKIYRLPLNQESKVLEKLEKAMLDKNVSSDEVTKDLSFPETLEGMNGITLTWTSKNTAVIDNNGKIVSASSEAQTADVQVTGTYMNETILEHTFTLKVMSQDAAETAALQAMELEVPDKDSVKGSFILPTSNKYGTKIEWKVPEGTSAITIVDKETYATAQVTRPEADTDVTLTATLKLESGDVPKDFPVKVIKKDSAGIMTDYVFAYFIGNNPGEEEIYLATSRDGLNWEELNDGKPILTSELGTKGLRDPFIFRSAEGDKFYLIATDLRICTDWNWGAAQTQGSQAIMVWESSDLVNWSEQRMVTVSDKIEAGCTWAPEVYYDESAKAYMVFWASKVKSDDYAKQRLYYCTTTDFKTFSEPKVWIDESHSTIDTTVVRDDDGTYYRFNKNESQTFVYLEKADSLLGTWTKVNENIVGGVEGPCCFKFNDDDVANIGATWCLLVDDFGGGGYFPMVTTSLASGKFTRISANLPAKPRHGTVMNITADEYNAVMNAYATPSVQTKFPEYVSSTYQLPDKVSVIFAEQEMEAGVTWDKTSEDFANSGKITVTGTLTGTGNKRIDGYQFTKTIEVFSDKLIYYIDSGVGSWNANMPTSSVYDTVSALNGITLRNQVPDQKYADDNTWGIVGGEDIVGNRTSTTKSLYANGWWARGGKDCEYVIPLESGTYSITGYFGEWWNVTRPMKFYAQYTNKDGQIVKSEEKTLTISKSNSNDMCTVLLTVGSDIADETVDVHIFSLKNGESDPVIAGLSIEKLATKEEDAALGTAEEAVDQIGVKKSAYELKVGEAADIQIEYPEGFTNKLAAAACGSSVAYSSSSNAITVDKDGKIQAEAAGTATVTLTFKLTRGSHTVKTALKTVTVTVTKNEQQIAEETVKAELNNIALAKASYDLTVDDTASIAVKYPDGFADALAAAGLSTTTTYSSEDNAITVDENGKITAKEAGTAKVTVTVTLNDTFNTSKELTATVNVTAKTPDTPAPDKVKLSVTKTMNLGLGESTKVTATVTDKAGKVLKNEKVTWSVDKNGKNVVTVKDGKITASKKKTGTATITAKTSNGKTAKVKVVVKKKPTKITLNTKSVTLKKNKTFQIKVKNYTPKNAASYKLTYSIDKKGRKAVSVDKNGKIKAKNKGKATITVTTFNKKKATIKVTVK